MKNISSKSVISKYFAIVIAIMGIIVCFSISASAEGELNGNGTEESPFQILSENDLNQMISDVNSGINSDKYYELANDLVITTDQTLPIGIQSNHFTGSFDGNNHKITGFKQKLTGDDSKYSGLFGYAENATIKNIMMEDVNINNTGSNAYAGGIVGYMKSGTLSGCKVKSGSVSSGNTAGGIAGYCNIALSGLENGAAVSGSSNAGGITGVVDSSVTIKNMKNTGTVNGAKAGGISGNSGSISASKNSGKINGTECAGGIVGHGYSGTVTNSENTGKVKAPRAGGIVGGETNVSKSSNKGAVESNGSYAAGIAVSGSATECYNTGSVTNSTSGGAAGITGIRSATDCYNTGKISSNGGNSAGISNITSSSTMAKTSYNIGVICGGTSNYAIAAYMTNCYYLDNRGTGGSGATSLTSEQMENQDSFSGFNFGIWTMDGIEEYPYPELSAVDMVDKENVVEGFASGKGTAKSPYHIQTAQQLVNMQKDPDAYYVLDNDIEFTSVDFAESGDFYNDGKYLEPVGRFGLPFAGSFDGNNHKITGFKQKLTGDDSNYSGLFGYAENATIKNITMEDVNINNTGSNAYAGGIVGYMNNGTLSGCKVLSGSVSSGKTAGSIAGYCNIALSGLENGAAVSGSSNAGGITGVVDSSVTIKNMKNTGTVNGAKAGGISGNSGSISASKNSGKINGTEYAGGIVGHGYSGTVTNSENTGKVKAPRAGGIVGGETNVSKSSNKGAVESNGSYAAGIAVSGSATECYNTGSVTNSTSGGAAGITGIRSATDCYNTGKISSNGGNSAGISNITSSSTMAKTSYNIGVICGGTSNYAIAAYMTNCYYLDNRGTGGSGATSLTSEQMEDQDSFAGFDFTTKWTMDGVESYPYPELNTVEMIDIENVVEGFASGKGTSKSPYHIQTAQQLVNMQKDPDAYYVLDNDIEFTSVDFAESGDFYNDGKYLEPVGRFGLPFAGSFDGNNHKITGFKQKLTGDDSKYSGLFGYAENATIKNIMMEDVNINNTGSNAYAGGIVGYMKSGTLSGCKVKSGSVSSGNTAGGIAGYCNIALSGLENGAAVSGSSNAGGITGVVDSSVTIKNMKNTGTVNGAKAGGISGNSGSISASKNSGKINGTECAGGIVGHGYSGTVTNSENTGKVKAPRAGGIVGGETNVSKSSNKGAVESNGSYAAGIAVSGSATECYNTGSVTNSTSGGAAGITGIRSATDCYNTGKISSNGGNSAGISNITSSSTMAKTSYNIGVICGGTSNYAIAAYMTNCYYLDNRGTGGSGATSLTSEQMEDQDSFVGFDFTTKWTMDGVESYPFPELRDVEMVSGEIEAIAELQMAAEINSMISALPAEIALENESDILAIREKYNAYIERFGNDAASRINDIDKLNTAEETMSALKEEYGIASHDLKNAVITIEDGLYNGSPITPEPIVTIYDTLLIKDTDYEVSYEDNIDIGTATVIIVGKGDYKNSTSKTFKIRKNEDAALLEKEKNEAIAEKEKAERELELANEAKETAERALAQSNSDKEKLRSDLNKANAAKAAAEQKLAAEKKKLEKIKALNVKVRVKAKSPKKGKARVTWSKVKNADGYYVYQAAKKNGKFKKVKTIKNGKTTKWDSKKLKRKKKYFYKIQAFVIIEGQKYSGKESNVSKVKVK